ncbi:MarR family winged helix-turn-helix transcriptional regulator [Dactylosporangium sp. CA-233914]|uniref:MarR family winged helix-turn-helix transcriptional regulator n=1 Tax=Dactylosporangium sp. CA-233914 TaxID=3239934 RepID=UPI003D916813
MAVRDEGAAHATRQPVDLVVSDMPLLASVQALSRAYLSSLRTVAEGLGVYAGQEQVLFVLARNGELPPGELARATGVDASSITRSVQRLEASGFLRRRRSTADRRSAVICLTPEGEHVVGVLKQRCAALEKHINARLDAAAAIQCLTALRQALADGE